MRNPQTTKFGKCNKSIKKEQHLNERPISFSANTNGRRSVELSSTWASRHASASSSASTTGSKLTTPTTATTATTANLQPTTPTKRVPPVLARLQGTPLYSASFSCSSSSTYKRSKRCAQVLQLGACKSRVSVCACPHPQMSSHAIYTYGYLSWFPSLLYVIY